MRTRRSPRNQEILWRSLGEIAKPAMPHRLKLVTKTENGLQFLVCGHTVALPPCWTGRYPHVRHCEQCRVESRS